MQAKTRCWRDCCGPVLLVTGAFCLINFLWNLPELALYDRVPPSLPVYLGGSTVALVVLWRAVRGGRMTKCDLGLDTSGWTVPKRLAGLALILLMGLGGYTTMSPPDAETVDTIKAREEATPSVTDAETPSTWPKPSWGDYCFWFVFMLAASLTELLVFVSVAFCFTERWLRDRGQRPIVATVAAALFASGAFGLFHFTHAPEFWGYVFFPLMPVMLINLVFFALTRNFWLTLALHNAFAAVGFTQLQYGSYPPPQMYDPAHLAAPSEFAPVLISFFLPFLALNLLEWKFFPRPSVP